MSVISVTTTPSAARASGRWRDWNLLALAGLHAYSTAIGWQAQAVSYPLYRAVGVDEFKAYHAAYNDSIPLVVIVPGFLTFLGAVAFWWTRPPDVPKRLAGLVSVSGLASLLSTVLWAIPRHDELDRNGQSADTIDSLIHANALRVAALSVGTVAISWSVGQLLRRRR